MPKKLPPGRKTLEALPARSLKFLQGAGTNVVIRAILTDAGYTQAQHDRGWSLVHRVTGYAQPGATPADEINQKARAAILELDAWDEDGLRRIGAALRHNHPDQYDFVFANDLKASTGMQAVLGVGMLLDRLDTLESGKDRDKALHKADQAALTTLKERKITKEERARLRGLVQTAKGESEGAPKPAAPAPPHDQPTDREKALLDLWAWYDEWSDTARSVIKRRIHLIALGLAKRRSRNAGSTDDTDDTDEMDDAGDDDAPAGVDQLAAAGGVEAPKQ